MVYASAFYLFFEKILFVHLTVRERERVEAGGAAGRGKGRSRLPAEQGAPCRTQSQDPGITT